MLEGGGTDLELLIQLPIFHIYIYFDGRLLGPDFGNASFVLPDRRWSGRRDVGLCARIRVEFLQRAFGTLSIEDTHIRWFDACELGEERLWGISWRQKYG